MYWHDTLVWPFASCRMAGVVWLYAYWRASFGIYETNHYVCHHLLYHHHFWCWPCPWSPSFSIMICVSFVCKEFIIELGVWLHLFVGICLVRDIKLWWLFSSSSMPASYGVLKIFYLILSKCPSTWCSPTDQIKPHILPHIPLPLFLSLVSVLYLSKSCQQFEVSPLVRWKLLVECIQ